VSKMSLGDVLHAKLPSTPRALHTLCPVPTKPWVDMSMHFVLGYLRLNVAKTLFLCGGRHIL